MEQLLKSRPRIEVVDALRGFAVMAIILLHNIEHFNLYSFPEPANDFMAALDQGVWANADTAARSHNRLAGRSLG